MPRIGLKRQIISFYLRYLDGEPTIYIVTDSRRNHRLSQKSRTIPPAVSMLDPDIIDLGSSTSLSPDTDSESSGTNLSGPSLEVDLAISRNTEEIKITAGIPSPALQLLQQRY